MNHLRCCHVYFDISQLIIFVVSKFYSLLANFICHQQIGVSASKFEILPTSAPGFEQSFGQRAFKSLVYYLCSRAFQNQVLAQVNDYVYTPRFHFEQHAMNDLVTILRFYRYPLLPRFSYICFRCFQVASIFVCMCDELTSLLCIPKPDTIDCSCVGFDIH